MVRSVPPLEMLTDLKQGSMEYKHVILGTYDFDVTFFEDRILPILQQRDAENILVLTDKAEYEKKFADFRRAGIDYFIDYCRCAQIFHPKFMLLIWPTGAKLVIGSANLTDNGWTTSGELLVNVEYDTDKQDYESASVLAQMKDYLNRLVEKQLLRSTKHKQKLIEALNDLDSLVSSSLQPLRTAEKSQIAKYILLHNIEKPILAQLTDVIKDERIASARILSPFFDPEGRILGEIMDLGCRDLEIIIQRDKVVGFPKEKMMKLKNERMKVKVSSIRFNAVEEQRRYIHAKLLLLRTTKRSYCLTGSANATAAALLSTVEKGNAELCFLRIENDRNYFDYLLNSKFDIKELALDEVPVVQFEIQSAKSIASQIVLTDARLDGRRLIIEYESSLQFDHAKVYLWHQDITQHKEILRTPSNQKADQVLSLYLNDDEFAFCSMPTFVTVTFRIEDAEIKSDRRWISTQALETALRRRTVDEIEKSGGRFGLISFFYRLEEYFQGDEWFLYFLQRIDFDNLPDSLNHMRDNLPRLQAAELEDNMEEVIAMPEERPEIDAQQIMRRIVNKHQRKLEDGLDEIEFESEFQTKFERSFNLFMFINKFVLWFVFSKRTDVTELSHVRANIERMMAFISRAKSERRIQHVLEPLLNKLQVWEHLIILCFIIHSYHKRSGYSMQKNNEQIMRVFNETYLETIKAWKRDDYGDLEKSISRALVEYYEFKDLDSKTEDVIYFCDLLVRIMS